MRVRIALCAALSASTLLTLPPLALAQVAQQALDHQAYDIWNRIDDEAVSADGRWVLYTQAPENGDATLRVHGLTTGADYSVPFAAGPLFSPDARYVAFLIKPAKDSVRAAKLADTSDDDMPRDALGILATATGDVVRIPDVTSFALPEKAGDWIAYHLKSDDEEEAEEEETEVEEPAEETDDQARKKDKNAGTPLVLRHLPSGEEVRIADVVHYAFAENGAHFAASTSTEDGGNDGVVLFDTATRALRTLASGEGHYGKPVFDEAGRQLAFLSDTDDYASDEPEFALYHWQAGNDAATLLASSATDGVPDGWWVSEHGTPSFSKSGQRLFFGTAPRPAPAPDDDTPEDEKVKLDVWHWRDPLIQPMQLVQLDDEKKRTYQAMVDLADNRVVQLASETVPEITVGAEGDAGVALGLSNLPYRPLVSWDDAYYDAYLVDVATGSRETVALKIGARATLSPDAGYVYWWDGAKRHWYGRSVDGGAVINLTRDIPHALHDETNDRPMLDYPYGSAGWVEDDRAFLVYDRHDIWSVDPRGERAPVNLTEGLGRAENLRLRYVRLDREAPAIDPGEPLLLSAFDFASKAGGFYSDRVGTTAPPEQLAMMDYRFGTPLKAEDAGVLLFTRESFVDFPDLWVSDLGLDDMRRVSHANPQQANYRWGSAELVSWTSLDGIPLDGLLLKPDGFDPSRTYPLMVYFYERSSDNLHAHVAPATSRSSINTAFYVSRGYLVFIPDIVYKIGYPGESALNAVVPGVTQLIADGYVDKDRIGVQGHSWGGYQIAYMVTRTNLFRAAEAGAPVANMISAYGGIRWASGMSRMFQYERTQSRIGGSLWDYPLRYVENSPIFTADKIETPLLMMHNDDDGAVPWYQGIELFASLRRLGKPVWMLNYNGEGHGLTKYHNKRDWAIRMQQFFDHYLMDAPAPVWMTDGIPAVKKGTTLGLDAPEYSTLPMPSGND